MEIILIFRQLSDAEKQEILSAKARGAEVLIMPGLMANIEAQFIPESIIKDASANLISTIKELGDKEIDHSTLSELLTIDNVLLWHYQRFRVFFLLKNEWIINRCIEHYSQASSNVKVFSSQKASANLNLKATESSGLNLNQKASASSQSYPDQKASASSQLIQDQKGSLSSQLIPDQKASASSPLIQDQKASPSSQSYPDQKASASSQLNPDQKANANTGLNLKSLFNYIIFFKLRIILSLIRRVKTDDKSNLVIDRSIRQVCRDINTLAVKKDNFNLYPLFDVNPPGQLIISEVETPKFKSSVPFKLNSYYFSGEGRKERTIYGEWILLKGLLSRSVWQKYKSFKAKLRELQVLCSQLPDTPNILDTFNVTFTRTERMILDTFFSLRKSSNFFLLKHLCYYNFFAKHQFKTISAIDENSPATRSILDAAKKCNITTIGIQHGNIGDSQPAYLYTEKDKQRKVMTDFTLTWGDYFTEFLTSKANYPIGSVKTVGQMRSDLIPAMNKFASEYRKKLTDLPFLAVFASQPIPDANYKYKVAYDVFSSFSKNSNAKLIVKLHPAERFDVDYYKSIAAEAGFQDPDIRYDIDLYELLAASDLVITCYSTVGSEAVYFNKPLIIYDPFKEDLLKYVSEGVAFQATDLPSLQQLIAQIQSGQLSADTDKYSRFIKKYAYAIDGQATRRTYEIINSS